MQNIINIIISVILVITSFIGGLCVVVGVQCLNSTTPITAILSIGAGSLLCAACLWVFPWSYWYGHWKNYTDRMTKEGTHLPLVKTGYTEEVKEEVKTYTQDELDVILDRMHKKHIDEICNLNLKVEQEILNAKDQVANHWSQECVRLALIVASKDEQIVKTHKLLLETRKLADYNKSMWDAEKAFNNSASIRAEISDKRELRTQRRMNILQLKLEMAEMRLDLVKPEVKAKIEKEFGRINDLLKDASIKVDGNCPEQCASFLSIIKSARTIMDATHIMWVKDSI